MEDVHDFAVTVAYVHDFTKTAEDGLDIAVTVEDVHNFTGICGSSCRLQCM